MMVRTTSEYWVQNSVGGASVGAMRGSDTVGYAVCPGCAVASYHVVMAEGPVAVTAMVQLGPGDGAVQGCCVGLCRWKAASIESGVTGVGGKGQGCGGGAGGVGEG